MIKQFRPNLYVRRITNIPIDYLANHNFKGVIIDLDNTIVPWDSNRIDEEFSQWIYDLLQSGIQLVLVSNNKSRRVKEFSVLMDVPYIASAVKPLRMSFLKALNMMDLQKQDVVVIGDQIFTDIWGGNMLGLYTILVEPMASKEFLGTKFLRMLERFVLNKVVMTKEKHEE